MSVFSSIAELQFHVRTEVCAPQCRRTKAELQWKQQWDKSPADLFVNVLFRLEERGSNGPPAGLFNCSVREGERDKINRGSYGRISFSNTGKRSWRCTPEFRLKRRGRQGEMGVSLCFVSGSKLPAAGSSELCRLPRLWCHTLPCFCWGFALY